MKIFPLPGQQIFKGNVHAHTTASDGKMTLAELIHAYEKLDYGFLVVTDHDIFTSEATLREFQKLSVTLFPGNEVTRNGSHLVQIGGTAAPEPLHIRARVLEQLQQQGALCVVPHPNWRPNYDHTSTEDILAWKNYIGVEVFNGSGVMNDTGSPLATEKWEMALSAGKKVWAFAVDDTHTLDQVGLGWICVSAASKSHSDIQQAILDGNFYASTGVEISLIERTENRLRIESPNAQRIAAFRESGRRFIQTDAQTLEFEIPSDAKFVRVQCWGQGEAMAWTQPLIWNF